MVGGRITSEEKSTLSTYIGLGVVTVLAAGAVYFFIVSHQEKKEVTGFDPNRPVPNDATLKRRLKPEQYLVVRENKAPRPPFKMSSGTTSASAFTSMSLPANHSSLRSTNSMAAPAVPTFTKPISKDLLVEKAGHFAGHAAHRGPRQTKRCPPWPSLCRPDFADWTTLRRQLGRFPFHSDRTNERRRLRSVPAARREKIAPS